MAKDDAFVSMPRAAVEEVAAPPNETDPAAPAVAVPERTAPAIPAAPPGKAGAANDDSKAA